MQPCTTKSTEKANPFCSILLTLLLVFLSHIASVAQCVAPSMTFNNPVLTGGTDKTVGAIYRFSNVYASIDAEIQILALHGGAALWDMDNTSQGYYDAWQPYVTAGGNDTSYLDWKITFKKTGTSTDTILPCLAITAVDVDGDGSKLKEYIVASTPGAYAVDPYTSLTVSFDGVNSTAIGSTYTYPNIDTADKPAMFQMNFTNVSTIIYRNGSISTKSSSDTRHTCIYFKPFFHEMVVLPVPLNSFRAKPVTNGAELNWTVSSSEHILYYTVQKSTDGALWKDAGTVKALTDAVTEESYAWFDKDYQGGITYYRIQQTTIQGRQSYSAVITLENSALEKSGIECPTILKGDLLPIRITTTATSAYTIRLYTMSGQLVQEKKYQLQSGLNQLFFPTGPQTTGSGLYMLTITNQQGLTLHNTKLVRP